MLLPCAKLPLMNVRHLFLLAFLTVASACSTRIFDEAAPVRPQERNSSAKPWTRWWWMGSAVDKPNIKSSLINFQAAGIGGVEITPIYGVVGEEANFIDFLTPEWVDMLNYTVRIADSLGMQVDMVLGTGWPYGGPHVTVPHAATKLMVEQYTILKGETLHREMVVTSVPEKAPSRLLHVLAFGKDGTYLDLTGQLAGNSLHWTAEGTDFTLYAVFSGKTGQQVKRAAPGGAGFTLDHFSQAAFSAYAAPFDEALHGVAGKLRAVFNDSYEVYQTDFTPDFFAAFTRRRGYDLKPFLPSLLDTTDHETGNRIKSDYRETISDLLLNEFNVPWTKWANAKKFSTRLQAHGSPGNLLDLYASAGIPECETFGSMPYDIPGLRREDEDIRSGDADPVMLKFSSSAAHISGKPLTSAESFTWLRDHFKTALSQCKPEVEDLFVNGVNHVFLHGATYSPARAAWPGWKFYASVNFNTNNTIWEDAPALFKYIENCQTLLQSGEPDNENLLYWPVYDNWGAFAKGTLYHEFPIHKNEWLLESAFYRTANKLLDLGYGVDFVSDAFINQASVKNGMIVLPGGAYKSLIIPPCHYLPLATLEKLVALKNAGANVVFESLPVSVPGHHNYQGQNLIFRRLLAGLIPAENLPETLAGFDIHPETLGGTGLKFTRRRINGEKLYYLVNHTANAINSYLPVAVGNKEVQLICPLTGKRGNAAVEKYPDRTMVKLQLAPGESIFLKTEDRKTLGDWVYFTAAAPPIPITGTWTIDFKDGGPELPASGKMDTLKSWTTLNGQAEAFSGSAVYTIEFVAPAIDADAWQLNLGEVRESAKVWLNGEFSGNAWSVPFRLDLGQLAPGKNKLKIQVTNLAANRIRAKELRGEEWKIFYEINMVNKDYEVFDATKWDPMPSGLLGPVTLTPLKKIK